MGLLFINGVVTWLPDIMSRNGYNLGSSLSFSIFLYIGTIAGTFTWAFVADKKGFNILLPTIYIIGSIALMLMGVKTKVYILYIIVTLIGFFLFAAHSLVNAFVSQHYPDEIRTTAVGFANGAGRIGGISGSTVGGLLQTLNASVSTWFVTFGATGLIAAASFIIIILNPKRRGKETAGNH